MIPMTTIKTKVGPRHEMVFKNPKLWKFLRHNGSNIALNKDTVSEKDLWKWGQCCYSHGLNSKYHKCKENQLQVKMELDVVDYAPHSAVSKQDRQNNRQCEIMSAIRHFLTASPCCQGKMHKIEKTDQLSSTKQHYTTKSSLCEWTSDHFLPSSFHHLNSFYCHTAPSTRASIFRLQILTKKIAKKAGNKTKERKGLEGIFLGARFIR